MTSETFKNNIQGLTKQFETVTSPFDNFIGQDQVIKTIYSPIEKKPQNDGVKFFVLNGYQCMSALNQFNAIRRISAINNPDIVCTAGKLSVVEEDDRLYIQPGSITGVYDNPSFVLITIKNKTAVVTTYELNTVTDEIETNKFEIVRQFNIMTEEEVKEYEDQAINISSQDESDKDDVEKQVESSSSEQVKKPRRNRFEQSSSEESEEQQKKQESSEESEKIAKKRKSKKSKQQESSVEDSDEQSEKSVKKSKKSKVVEESSEESQQKQRRRKSKKQIQESSDEEVEVEQKPSRSSRKQKQKDVEDVDDSQQQEQEQPERKHRHRSHHHHSHEKRRDVEESS